MTVILVLVFSGALTRWLEVSGSSSTYSHLVAVPLVSAWFLFQDRSRIWEARRHLSSGSLVMVSAIVLLSAVLLFTLPTATDPVTSSSLEMAIFILALLVLFAVCFGAGSTGRAIFPLGFLLFSVPLPPFMMEPVVRFLQHGTSVGVELIFRVAGAVHFRDGNLFSLPGVSIFIGPECSSIRSSTALLLTAVISARLFLTRWWSRAAAVLLAIPLAALKNSIRVSTLTWLGINVDPSYLGENALHRRGGFVFFIFSVVIFLVLIGLLRFGEKRAALLKEPTE
jgi:exosortase